MKEGLTLYSLKNGIGYWYVVSTDPTSAVKDLEGRLNSEDYGFSSKRKVTEIKVLSEEVVSGLGQKWFFSRKEATLLLPHNRFIDGNDPISEM